MFKEKEQTLEINLRIVCFDLQVLCLPRLYPCQYVSQLLSKPQLPQKHQHQTRRAVFYVIFNEQQAPKGEFLHVLDPHISLTPDPQYYDSRRMNRGCTDPRQKSRRKTITWQVVQELLDYPLTGISSLKVWNHENTRRWLPQLTEPLRSVFCI